MKISKKLQQEIDELIRGSITEYLMYLDSLDRSSRISHKAWQLTHKQACGLPDIISARVNRAIEFYRKPLRN